MNFQDYESESESGHGSRSSSDDELEQEICEYCPVFEKEYKNLEKKHANLENKHTALEMKHTALERKHTALEKKHTDLEKKRTEVELNNTDLEKKHTDMEKKHTDMEKKHTDMEKKHTDLDMKHTVLEKKHTDLEMRQIDFEEKHTVLEKKYKDLVAKLRDRVECPVCFEVPESGPVFSCPNGHLVCSSCKADSCPSCRTEMFSNKSMLAVTVLENIEHQCNIEGCDVEVLFGEMEDHKKKCIHRIIYCPATECEEAMKLCNIIDHLLNECCHSFARENNGLTDLLEKHGPYRRYIETWKTIDFLKVYTYTWNGRYFFMNIERDDDHGWAFHVEMLGSESECSEYGFDLTVHRTDDEEATGKHVYRLKGEPCSVDEEQEDKKFSGLIIGNNIMNKKLLLQIDEELKFQVSIEFSRDIVEYGED